MIWCWIIQLSSSSQRKKNKILENGLKNNKKQQGNYTDWYDAKNGNKEKQRWQIGAFLHKDQVQILKFLWCKVSTPKEFTVIKVNLLTSLISGQYARHTLLICTYPMVHQWCSRCEFLARRPNWSYFHP